MIVQGVHRKTVWYEDDKLVMVNQPLLPHTFEMISFEDYRDAAKAIKTMVVRGAPAIGATAAYAMALAQRQGEDMKGVGLYGGTQEQETPELPDPFALGHAQGVLQCRQSRHCVAR